MAKKTNKTSHVLNLITNGNTQENETPAAQEAAPAAKQPQAGASASSAPANANPAPAQAQAQPGANPASGPVPANPAETAPAAVNTVPGSAPVSEKKVIVVDDSAANRISDEIRDQLISHLEETENKAKAEMQMENKPVSESVAEPEKQPTVENAVELKNAAEPELKAAPEVKAAVEKVAAPEQKTETPVQPEPQPAPEVPVQPEPQPAPEVPVQPEQQPTPEVPVQPEVKAAPQAPTQPQPEQQAQPAAKAETQPEDQAAPQMPEYRMVNVMEQILKRYNLERQMKLYDVCMCSRCRADVLALALTRLPAKYVVVDNSTVAPIIGYYENKYKVNIMTQAIKACLDVKEKPRHKEGEH